MTTSLTFLTHPAAADLPGYPPVDASADPWAGLTDADATRIAAGLAATARPNRPEMPEALLIPQSQVYGI